MVKKYINNIDAVRGIAILLVLSYHTFLILYPGNNLKSFSENGVLIIPSVKSFLLCFNPIAQGWVGVELFLVISGFLIHFIYLQNRNSFKWGEFFSKRFWRIYPPYLIVLLFLFIHRPDTSSSGITNIVAHLLMVHNLSDTTFFSINGSFWSVALECQLYLIYPAFLFLLNKLNLHKTAIALFSLLIISILIEMFFSIYSLTYGTFVLKFWFIWAAGSFLAEKYYTNQRIFNKPLLWFIVFYFLFFAFKLFWFSSFFILIPATLACLALMETFLYNQLSTKHYLAGWTIQFLSTTGLISYSIYLIHHPYLPNLLHFFSPTSSIMGNLLGIAFTYTILFLISYALYKLVELKSIEYGKLFRKK